MDYRGQHCPICGKEFCDGDDIVVCPECGTPYHRECYKTAGHCVNEEHQGESFEWKPETAPQATVMNMKLQIGVPEGCMEPKWLQISGMV